MTKKEITKAFTWLSAGELENALKYTRKEYKTERGFINYLTKKNDENARIFGMCDVKEMELSIEWHGSQTWGYNPVCYYRVWMADGSFHDGKTTCRGCGYDKHSTVVADVFNKFCKGMAYRKRNSRKYAPYGLQHVGKGKDKKWQPYFEGGVGISCYSSIVAYLGGTMESHSGRTWDYHTIKFNNKKK